MTSAGGSIFIQQMFFVAKAQRQLQMFFVAKAQRQLQMFFVAKAQRQLQMFGHPLKRDHIRIHLTTFRGESFLLNEDRAKANSTTIEAIF
ncbi:hypothetical protein [Lysinibacillus zambalensis]|uniref:hypothetical protein n=1 Tax=Lysinibacillus zambalensis TaxID=3160866 RepID=UPI0032E44E0D